MPGSRITPAPKDRPDKISRIRTHTELGLRRPDRSVVYAVTYPRTSGRDTFRQNTDMSSPSENPSLLEAPSRSITGGNNEYLRACDPIPRSGSLARALLDQARESST